MKFILGKKIGMTRVFDKEGRVLPVTLIQAGPCFVTQVKTKEKDGYRALQIGFEKISKAKKIKKTQKGKEYRYLREVRLDHQNNGDKENTFTLGQKIDVSIFEPESLVKISGISKGKGFQGGVKRHGFHGRDATHGVKHEERTIGSIGTRFPQRVVKGRRMPGHMGEERVTVRNLQVIKVDPEKNLLLAKGAVPGRRGTLLEISSIEKR